MVWSARLNSGGDEVCFWSVRTKAGREGGREVCLLPFHEDSGRALIGFVSDEGRRGWIGGS